MASKSKKYEINSVPNKFFKKLITRIALFENMDKVVRDLFINCKKFFIMIFVVKISLVSN
jgi:hypothetical protein